MTEFPLILDEAIRRNFEEIDRRLLAVYKGAPGINQSALFADYTNIPNGPIPKNPSGQTEIASDNGVAGAALSVVGGKLTDTAVAGAPAGYIDYNLGAPVKSLGIEFTFNAGSTYAGTVALLVWKSSVSTAGGVAPDSPCHFYCTPDGWGYQYFSGGAPTLIRGGTFNPRLTCDGSTVYRIEIFMIGSTAVVTLPDGSIAELTDSHISSLAANYVGYEILLGNAATDARPGIITRWADTVPVSPYDFRSRGAHVLRQIAAAVKATEPILTMPTSLVVTVATPTFPTISNIHAQLQTFITAPASGAFIVECEGYVSQTGNDRLVWGMNANSVSSSQSMTQTVTELRTIGLVQAQFAFKGFQPGETVQLDWQHTSLAGLSSFVIDTGGFNYRPKLKVTPLGRVF